MTAIASPENQTLSPALRRQNPLALFFNTVLVFFFPRLARSWPRASLSSALLVALLHVLAGLVWGYLIIVTFEVWYFHNASPKARATPISIDSFRTFAHSFNQWFADEWRDANLFDRLSPFAGLALALSVVYLLPFFVVLPFAARPGPNKPCLRHVARTILLGSGMVHVWGAAIVGLLVWFAHAGLRNPVQDQEDYNAVLTLAIFLFFVLSLWTLLVLVYAGRQEYRTAADLPQPHDPWCDDCGYTLTGIDAGGRCPECGRPIQDSLGPGNRPPTPWESAPHVTNVRVILRQARDMVLRPRTVFFAMPTLSGQAAAQRWLIGSAVLLFVMALPIVPMLVWLMQWGDEVKEMRFVIVPGALLMALAWAVFGLMMVGIESAGLATFSRMRKLKVQLATATKVTSYSCFLMIPWVVLGGGQLIAYTAFAAEPSSLLNRYFHLSMRAEQIVLAVSLTVAHIGGLLWYELTVYRGMRAIQYANR